MAIGDQDIQAGTFFRDCTLVTTADGGAQFMAHFEYPDALANFSPLNVMAPEVASRPEIRYSTTDADLEHGTVLLINGAQWKVRSVRREGDGQVSCAELAGVVS